MKTTVEVGDGLARVAGACAAERGETLGGVAGRVLADHVESANNDAPSPGLPARRGRPVPGAGIDSRAALHDLMDARD